jgi:hypothetical protein
MRRKKLHWSVVPIKNGLYSVESQYGDVIREKTPNGLFDYSIIATDEAMAENFAKQLNENNFIVQFNNRNLLEKK